MRAYDLPEANNVDKVELWFSISSPGGGAGAAGAAPHPAECCCPSGEAATLWSRRLMM